MALSGRQGGNGEDEKGKERERKEGSEGGEEERKEFPLKHSVPQCFSKRNWHLCFEMYHPGMLL